MKNRVNLGPFKIATSLDEVSFQSQGVINTINPHSYVVSKHDPDFKVALIQSDYLFPDGIGIVLAHRILNGGRIHKIAGYDIFIHLMKELNKNKGSCFFLGSSNQTLGLIKKKAAKEFPDVRVSCFSPPFKKTFTTKDCKEMISAVNMAEPDFLFVGMTAPKQEKWVYENKDLLKAEIICSIGAVFDFYSGSVKRPSRLWRSLSLEWLYRFIKEPKRLFRRNMISTPKFMFAVLMSKLFNKDLN